MIALVTGGASSGKSAFAEQLALTLPAPHYYLAAMRPGGAEAARRIEKHVRARSGKGFITVELNDPPVEIAHDGGTLLVEDLSNLIVNGLDDLMPRILSAENAVFVTNEVGCDGIRYDTYTSEFIDRLGQLSCEVAARADVVVEVVAGLPNVVKGELL